MSMVRRIGLSLMAASWAFCALAEIPDVLYEDGGASRSSPEERFPIWVSAAATLRDSGQVDRRLFHPHVADRIEEILDWDPTQGCYASLPNDCLALPSGHWTTLRSALTAAQWVFLGTVTSTTGGIGGAGRPSILVGVTPDRIFKGSRGFRWQYFFWIHSGRFDFGPVTVCPTSFYGAGSLSVGDRVVLVVEKIGGSDKTLLYTSGALGVWPLRGHGLDLPRHYLAEPDLPLLRNEEDLARFVHEVLEGK